MVLNYLKIAVKVLLRRKVFTFISLFGISLTLLVLITVTALLDHSFGPLPPETRLGRSLGVFRVRMSGEHMIRNGNPGYRFLDRFVRTLPDVEKVSIHSEPQQVACFKSGERISLYLKRTDGEFWQILEFRFLEGGAITLADEKNANFVAVINEATRAKLFGSEPAVGKTLEADGQRFRVVGVVPNVPFFRRTPFADVWVPISTSKSDSYKHDDPVGGFMATILAHSPADLPGIRRELQRRMPDVELTDPKTFNKVTSAAETFFEATAGEIFGSEDPAASARFLGLILGLMVLFMVLPTINLVNLNVSRIMERASEIGVRKSFGASRRALIAQFVVENVFLCLIGGALGFALSFVALRLVTASGLIPYGEFHVNVRIFLYGLGLATFFGVFSGVYPAWKMSRLLPVEALRGGTR